MLDLLVQLRPCMVMINVVSLGYITMLGLHSSVNQLCEDHFTCLGCFESFLLTVFWQYLFCSGCYFNYWMIASDSFAYAHSGFHRYCYSRGSVDRASSNADLHMAALVPSTESCDTATLSLACTVARVAKAYDFDTQLSFLRVRLRPHVIE